MYGRLVARSGDGSMYACAGAGFRIAAPLTETWARYQQHAGCLAARLPPAAVTATTNFQLHDCKHKPTGHNNDWFSRLFGNVRRFEGSLTPPSPKVPARFLKRTAHAHNIRTGVQSTAFAHVCLKDL